MKKITPLLLLFFFCFSCGDADKDWMIPSNNDASRPGPVVTRPIPKLSKINLYPGQTNEKRLSFYPNGRLKSIANNLDQVYQQFFYDNRGNLTSITGSNASTFTYDSHNLLTSCNGQTVTYNAALNKYVYQYPAVILNNDECTGCYDYLDRLEITLSNEKLFKSETEFYASSDADYVRYGLSAHYSGTNLLNAMDWLDPSGPHYHYANTINPLKPAALALCRAMAIHAGNISDRFIEPIYSSSNNLLSINYDMEDPESEQYETTYNQNNFPVSVTRKIYYFGTLEYTGLYAQYFYQSN